MYMYNKKMKTEIPSLTLYHFFTINKYFPSLKKGLFASKKGFLGSARTAVVVV